MLCRERTHGESRYPYGNGGFNFWVNASGYMHANEGLFHILLPASAGQDPPVAFLAGMRRRASDDFIPFALTPAPYIALGEALVKKRSTIIGHDATYFLTELNGLCSAVRVHVDQACGGAPQVYFAVSIRNESDSVVEMFTSTYIDLLCRHQFAATHEDRWFKTIDTVSHQLKQTPQLPAGATRHTRVLPSFRVTVNEDVSRAQSSAYETFIERCVSGSDTTLRSISSQVCTARNDFTGGLQRSIANATHLRSGTFARPCPSTTFVDNAVVGDLHRFSLRPGDGIRFDCVLCLPDPARALPARRIPNPAPAVTDRSIADARRALDDASHDLRLEFGKSQEPRIHHATFNQFLPYLNKQVSMCAQIKGYLQPSPNSLIGIRDVFQAIEAHLFDQPEVARAKILEALEYVLIDGRCPRQYSLPANGTPGTADMREFIDQGAWVISTLHTYLRTTGDFHLLDEVIGYHCVDTNRPNAIARADETGTVLDHLVRIMKYLERQRDPDTQLVLALYGDWNDALDGLGVSTDAQREFGTGVSVMASLQFYRNTTEMIELLTEASRRDQKSLIERYHRLGDQLRDSLLRFAVVEHAGQRRILHGWGDERSYFVGGFDDCDGRARDALTSNAFWVLSGMLAQQPNLRGDIISALERLDSVYGLKTFEPGFAPDAPGVGRIPKLPLGTAENGATYVHATAFAVMALFRMGEPKRAWDQICKILPIAPHHVNFSHSPFVMPNSYVHNPALGLDGQSMNDWQTGSSNVLQKTLIHDVAGFQPAFRGLRIAPARWCPFDSFTFEGRAHGRQVCIEYRSGSSARRSFRIDGVDRTLVKSQSGCAGDAVWIPYRAIRPDECCTIHVED